MARAFKLPDLGEGIHEGEVLSVLVAVGDDITEGDLILEVETDKAAVEIPSPYTGKILEILVKPGDIVKVGDALMTFSNGDEAEVIPAEISVPSANALQTQPKEDITKPIADQGPVPASPATRRLARELDVDLRKIEPSGSGGRVTAEDVRRFAAQAVEPAPLNTESILPSAPPVAPVTMDANLPNFSKWGTTERVPFRSIRRAIGKQMSLAWSQIPHVTSQGSVDITRLEEFRRRHINDIEAKGGKLTLSVFALKAAATALRAYPNFNASLDLENEEIIIKHYYHIGVAVDTAEGLIVPVIRDVDRKSITELAIELNELVQRTRARKASLDDMQGGTFTITNIGPMGTGYFAPIINYPQVAIMGLGAAKMQPVVIENETDGYEIVPRLILPVVLTIDHRVLDGADASRFMQVVIDSLQDPDELLMTMV